MKSEFLAAITQLSSEKGVPKEMVLEALKAALVSAYKRNFDSPANDLVAEIRPGRADRTGPSRSSAAPWWWTKTDRRAQDGISVYDQILIEDAEEVAAARIVEGEFGEAGRSSSTT